METNCCVDLWVKICLSRANIRTNAIISKQGERGASGFESIKFCLNKLPQLLVLVVHLRLSSDGPMADIFVFSPLYFVFMRHWLKVHASASCSGRGVSAAHKLEQSKALQTLFITNHQKPPDTTSHLDFNIGSVCVEQMEG